MALTTSDLITTERNERHTKVTDHRTPHGDELYHLYVSEGGDWIAEPADGNTRRATVRVKGRGEEQGALTKLLDARAEESAMKRAAAKRTKLAEPVTAVVVFERAVFDNPEDRNIVGYEAWAGARIIYFRGWSEKKGDKGWRWSLSEKGSPEVRDPRYLHHLGSIFEWVSPFPHMAVEEPGKARWAVVSVELVAQDHQLGDDPQATVAALVNASYKRQVAHRELEAARKAAFSPRRPGKSKGIGDYDGMPGLRTGDGGYDRNSLDSIIAAEATVAATIRGVPLRGVKNTKRFGSRPRSLKWQEAYPIEKQYTNDAEYRRIKAEREAAKAAEAGE